MLDFHLVKALHSAAGPAALDVRLHIAPGEFVALSGPSGAGKTTLLRLLAGLTRPDAGHLRVAGHPWDDVARHLHRPPQHRAVGFVFQDYALFPHMTVRQNLAFALPDRRDTTTVPELLALMELEQLADRRPAQLSGGQQQRVALARALARRPRLLLLDEPLAAVDAATRQRLQHALAEAHRQQGLTTLLVSHDPAEIYTLATRVVELDLGRVAYDGPPRPAPAGTRRGTVLALLPDGRVRVLAGGQELVLPLPAGQQCRAGEQVVLAPTAWAIQDAL